MKIITANKLNRLFNNGIKPLFEKAVAKTKVLTTLTQISANTNTENVAGATAVKELYNNLTAQLPNNVKIVTEGSGANTKYYIQAGADAASKKPLGSGEIKLLFLGTATVSSSGTYTQSFTNDKLKGANIIGCQLGHPASAVQSSQTPEKYAFALKYDGDKWQQIVYNRTTFNGLTLNGNTVTITFTGVNIDYSCKVIHFFVAYI